MAKLEIWNVPLDQEGAPDRPPDEVVEHPSVCDFCEAPEPGAAYDCPDFTVQGTLPSGMPFQHVSVGGWSACAACAALIDAGDIPGVGRRMLEQIMSDPTYPSDALRLTQARLSTEELARFFSLRAAAGLTGQKEPLAPAAPEPEPERPAPEAAPSEPAPERRAERKAGKAERRVIDVGPTVLAEKAVLWASKEHPECTLLQVRMTPQGRGKAEFEGPAAALALLEQKIRVLVKSAGRLLTMPDNAGEPHRCHYCQEVKTGPWCYFTGVLPDGTEDRLPPVCEECAHELNARHARLHGRAPTPVVYLDAEDKNEYHT